ncbi:MAG: type II toxin-antitoxin system RelE/ParE family toxin [Chitinophagaceae bacterium]|nr:type II toxin-antitoxin system RelE/ParE family toxin [Chitinophagaceae bacterium]
MIQQFPERYAKRKDNFREAPVKVFPYIVVYTFYKTKRIITVSSIFHTSRNPRMKYNREK